MSKQDEKQCNCPECQAKRGQAVLVDTATLKPLSKEVHKLLFDSIKKILQDSGNWPRPFLLLIDCANQVDSVSNCGMDSHVRMIQPINAEAISDLIETLEAVQKPKH